MFKFVHVFCVVMLFVSIYCDEISLDASHNDMQFGRGVDCAVSYDSIKVSYSFQNDSDKLLTTIKWEAAKDAICEYSVHLYATQDENYSTSFEQNLQKLQPFELGNFTTEELTFETEYILEIHAANSKYPHLTDIKSTVEFVTPTCWDIHGINMEKCRPLPLSNIRATNEVNSDDTYGINITWTQPKHLPESYQVSINTFTNKGKELSQNVSGTKNYAYFPAVNTTDIQFDVSIISYSTGGYTVNPIIEFDLVQKYRAEQDFFWIGILLIGIVVVILLLMFCTMKNRSTKRKYCREILSKNIILRQMTQSYGKDDMEISPANVELHEELGQGAFGIVRKGVLKQSKQHVAVKMLKENAGIEDIKCFLAEISLMKSVGQHENIVGIVGHSTKLVDKLMLLTEYCSDGNLLDYLRRFGETPDSPNQCQFNTASTYKMTTDINSPHFAVNQLYDQFTFETERNGNKSEFMLMAENEAYDIIPSINDCAQTEVDLDRCEKGLAFEHHPEIPFLQSRDLLMFAKQIATGMKFLSSHKIVHRDLAARNILVCSDKTVKIADFGLSRDIYADNVYVKSGSGRLPIKWLALESLKDNLYTSQSDVWSYGILLYEIVTLGHTPYPAIPGDCLYLIDYLKTGNRMKKPHNCSQEIYELMHSCWNGDPESRPTFGDISEKIDWFLCQSDLNRFISVEKSGQSEWFNELNGVQVVRRSGSYLNPFSS